MMYDVIIIGGGPAGSTAGIYLSKKGYNVLIIDKEKFPRDKLCGGALTEKTISLLKEIGISDYRNVIDYKTLLKKERFFFLMEKHSDIDFL